MASYPLRKKILEKARASVESAQDKAEAEQKQQESSMQKQRMITPSSEEDTRKMFERKQEYVGPGAIGEKEQEELKNKKEAEQDAVYEMQKKMLNERARKKQMNLQQQEQLQEAMKQRRSRRGY